MTTSFPPPLQSSPSSIQFSSSPKVRIHSRSINVPSRNVCVASSRASSVTLLDYGAGNVRSVRNAIRYLGFDIKDVQKPEDILDAEHLVFPGVGAFAAAMEVLRRNGMDEALCQYIEQGRPFLGICLGLQLLFETSDEGGPGGGLGENDMDYDTDEQSMATLRRQLRIAREEYYRYKSVYMTYIIEALELEDTIKNYECREMTGWKYISSFRPIRAGVLGGLIDTVVLLWRCILRKQLEKVLSVILAIISAAILLAEATLLPSGLDLSLFSILIKAVGNQEILVQIAAFIPLMYMCICTYYSLFKIGMLMFYSFTPRQTSSVSLLMICSMVARYAPPISYNFLNFIRLDGNTKTIFEKRMGNIDDAVPFFGQKFNKIYPLIMVVYTLLVASNFFVRVFSFLGSWKRFRLQKEEDDTDGFDPAGIIILQKERSYLEQGHNVGEQVIPLARNFNNANVGIETGNNRLDKAVVETVPNNHTSSLESKERGVSSASVSLLNPTEARSQSRDVVVSPSSGISSTWLSMKTGFKTFKANLEAKKFQVHEPKMPLTNASSSESLDEIFHKLKNRPTNQKSQNDEVNFDSDIL